MFRGAVLLLALTLLTSSILAGCGGPTENTAEWHLVKSYKLLEQGRYDEAIEECTKAIELDPDYVSAYSNRGGAYIDKRQYDLAIADYTKAIELDPDWAIAYKNRAYAYLNKGQYDLAIADATKAIELDPNDVVTYYNRGLTYKEQGKKTEAITDFEKCITLAAKDPNVIQMARQQIEELSKRCDLVLTMVSLFNC